jgi:hypothetical protein
MESPGDSVQTVTRLPAAYQGALSGIFIRAGTWINIQIFTRTFTRIFFAADLPAPTNFLLP